jgi:hypothetical protein
MPRVDPEVAKDVRAFLTAQSAVEDGGRPRHRALDVQQRVAILAVKTTTGSRARRSSLVK